MYYIKLIISLLQTRRGATFSKTKLWYPCFIKKEILYLPAGLGPYFILYPDTLLPLSADTTTHCWRPNKSVMAILLLAV